LCLLSAHETIDLSHWLFCNMHMNSLSLLQGGEDPWDALGCRSFFAKEPLILGLFCMTWPIKIRHPVTLRHPVLRYIYNVLLFCKHMNQSTSPSPRERAKWHVAADLVRGRFIANSFALHIHRVSLLLRYIYMYRVSSVSTRIIRPSPTNSQGLFCNTYVYISTRTNKFLPRTHEHSQGLFCHTDWWCAVCVRLHIWNNQTVPQLCLYQYGSWKEPLYSTT